MKILHVSPSYYPAIQFGGPIQSVHLLNKSLMAQGIGVDVVTTNAGLENDRTYTSRDWIMHNDVRIRYFPYHGYIHYNFSIQLYSYLQKTVSYYDLVHITAVWNFPVWAAAHACRKAGVPYVISPRGTIYPETIALKSTLFKKAYYQLMARQCLQEAAAIHYTTLDEQEKVSHYLQLATPGFVIPNGVDLAGFASLDQVPPFSTFFPEVAGKKYILFLSRINIKKGLDILVDAFAEVCKQFPDTVLVIAGPDNEGYATQVKELLAQNELMNNAFFPGMLSGDAKLAAYRDARLFVLPSYSENFGMSVVEAMACGTPVVISDQVGIAQDIAAHEAGLVTQTTSASVARAINIILTDNRKREQLGRNGYKMAAEYYDIDSVGERFKGQYQQIIADQFVIRNPKAVVS